MQHSELLAGSPSQLCIFPWSKLFDPVFKPSRKHFQYYISNMNSSLKFKQRSFYGAQHKSGLMQDNKRQGSKHSGKVHFAVKSLMKLSKCESCAWASDTICQRVLLDPCSWKTSTEKPRCGGDLRSARGHSELFCFKYSSQSGSHEGGFTLLKMLSCLPTGSMRSRRQTHILYWFLLPLCTVKHPYLNLTRSVL